jgi:uncharacterized protein involved in copper resistance
MRVVPMSALAVLMLTACAPADDAASSQAPARKTLPGPPVAQEAPPQEPAMSCDPAKAQFAVGQAYSDTLAERARVAASARTVRRLSPGQAVTMEFRADRLNLETGEDGRIATVRCG